MGNEEQMPRVPLPDELLAIIAQRYGLSLGQALIRSYREAGGLCKSEEYLAFIPFIRWRLRQRTNHHSNTHILLWLEAICQPPRRDRYIIRP
jgi:hypothetical protein